MLRDKNGKVLVLGFIVLVFSIVFTMWFFYYNFYFDIGDTHIITPLVNQSLKIGNSNGLNMTTQMDNHLASLPGKYRGTDLAPDFYFFLMFGAFVIGSIYVAVKSRKENIFSFFGTMTVGLMVFYLAMSYIETLREWLVINLIIGVGQIDLSNTILIEAYMNNMIMVNSIIVLILIIINQFDFKFIKKEGRIEA